MRELTWQEKLVDRRYNGAITKWCQAIEETVLTAPVGVRNIKIVPVETYEQERYVEEKLFEDGTDVIWYNYKLLPPFKGEWTKIVLLIIDENGLDRWILL